MKFSERMGIVPARLDLQIDDIDEPLRNSLWNAVHAHFFCFKSDYKSVDDRLYFIAKTIWRDFYKRPIDSMSLVQYKIVQEVRSEFMGCSWWKVYDFIEFLISIDASFVRCATFVDEVNTYMAREGSAYRVVSGNICAITSQIEIETVNSLVDQGAGFAAAAEHMSTAIKLYSDRKEPNFRNSIKESISAIESVVRVISQSQSATLGDALKIVAKERKMHSALRESVLKLYGYTNDEGGIRHSLVDADIVDEVDARLMLVVCSAICNFMIAKYTK